MGKNKCSVEKKWCKFCKHGSCFFESCTPLKEIHRCPKRELTRTTRLKDLLEGAEDEEILAALFKNYDDQEKNRDGYLRALFEMRHTKAQKTDWFIRVSKIHEEARTFMGTVIPESEYFDVDGRAPNGKYYAIEFMPWSQWLGMNIEQATLDLLPKEDLLSHILWEMTYAGYSSNDVSESRKDLDDIYKDLMKQSIIK